MGSRCNGLAMCPQEGGPPSLVQLWMMLLHANQPVPVSPELKGVVQRQIYRLIVPDDNVYTYMHVYIYIHRDMNTCMYRYFTHIYIHIYIYIHIQPTTRAHWYWNGIPPFFHGILFVSPEQGTIPPPPPDEPAPATAARQAWGWWFFMVVNYREYSDETNMIRFYNTRNTVIWFCSLHFHVFQVWSILPWMLGKPFMGMSQNCLFWRRPDGDTFRKTTMIF